MLANDTEIGAGAPAQSEAAPQAEVRWRLVPMSIGFLLALLMTAIIVPAMIFSVILLQRNNSAQQELLTTLAEATAGSIAETVDRHILGIQTTLRVLSTSQSLQQGELADFYYRSKTALSDSGAYLSVIVGEMTFALPAADPDVPVVSTAILVPPTAMAGLKVR